MRPMYRSDAPVACVTSCQGTMFEWCSISVRRISSPSRRKVRPQPWATRLIDSVVPRVKISRAGRRAEEPRDPLTRALVRLRGLFPERVDAAMRVRVVVPVELGLGLDHRDRLLGRGGRVEVHERFALELPLQDREVTPDRVHVEHGRLLGPRVLVLRGVLLQPQLGRMPS